ncbi:MAG: PSD1 and planctomycete cytochrome C domain-containing protein [Verrucomicrobia bacterium]|nr:PSD1 and planctomycete cytochrome C domain-containing protein [Verrucomicrobiota bacterium]
MSCTTVAFLVQSGINYRTLPFSSWMNHLEIARVYRLFCLTVLVIMLTSSLSAQELPDVELESAERLFTLKVLPILSEKCFGCHGDDPDEIESGLILHTREDILIGGDGFGDVLVPGDAEASFMMTAVRWTDPDYEMPPKENDRLSEQQISDLEKWIAGGAPWPDEEAQARYQAEEWSQEETDEGILFKTIGGLSDEWTYRRYKPENIWSFQPVAKVKPPSEGSHPIDAFIDARIEAAGLTAAPVADPATLIRRATYDLNGLPPSPKEIAAFEKASQENDSEAWESLLDRLIESPRYGERMAQHWLDVTRYADTSGFSNDWERSNAWRYRDYVIRSFNKDKPYNRFVMEQLAGDEMDPFDPEMIVAAGYLRTGPWEHTAMTPIPVSRQLYLDDLVNIVGQTFMSTTMRCFKCHDHKFDPLPTEEYYRMYAAFSTTQPVEREAHYLPEENTSAFEEQREQVQTLLDFAEEKLAELKTIEEEHAKEWFAERELEYVSAAKRKILPDEEKPPRFYGLNSAQEGEIKVREQDIRIWSRAMERFEPLAQSVYSAGMDMTNSQKLRVADPAKAEQIKKARSLPKSHILTGGDVYSEDKEVSPGVISALGIPTAYGSNEDLFALPTGMSSRRLELAKWIAQPENQLTTRSIANRVWAWHFGIGIAANPNNFGTTGNKPTHPKLLDYLANQFVERGWSIKKFHKFIMTSEAYKRASDHPDIEALQTKDPDNDLLAVFEPRRLTAEEMRDTMLFVSGSLSYDMGGLPSRPEINMEVAMSPRMIQFSLAPAYQPSRMPERRNRRSIYSLRIRGLEDPFMEVFNKPNANASCERRDSPSVTPQVFTMMNSDEVTSRSLEMALRLNEEAKSYKDQITQGYRLIYGSEPTSNEMKVLTRHYKDMVKYHKKVDPEQVVYPTSITRSLVEEFSGESFEYEEYLNMYEEYTPDPQASEVEPEVRAMADICLLFFNSNKFAFVY